jgi:hypothetical protein
MSGDVMLKLFKGGLISGKELWNTQNKYSSNILNNLIHNCMFVYFPKFTGWYKYGMCSCERCAFKDLRKNVVVNNKPYIKW